MKKKRIILHADMDAFFASVEVAENPTLKDKAVIVGGNPDHRGVVSTCSYEARKFGVRSAMSLSEAKKRCPHAVFLTGNYSLYSSYSKKVMSIFKTLTFKTEVVSVDEAYLDVSDLSFKSPHDLAKELKEKIYDKVKLTCTIGIAPNKLLAKIASGFNKPNGIYEIKEGHEKEFLAPLPINTLPGIGEKTTEYFLKQGFHTIRDIQTIEPDYLVKNYGALGYHLYLVAQGKDNREVFWGHRDPKSIGKETTFNKDCNDKKYLEYTLTELVKQTHRYLLKEKGRTRNLCLKLRDENFKTMTYSKMLFSDTNDLKTILEASISLFQEVYQENMPLRLIGISFRKLSLQYWQPTFWD